MAWFEISTNIKIGNIGCFVSSHQQYRLSFRLYQVISLIFT